jgi:hypothetical protein
MSRTKPPRTRGLLERAWQAARPARLVQLARIGIAILIPCRYSAPRVRRHLAGLSNPEALIRNPHRFGCVFSNSSLRGCPFGPPLSHPAATTPGRRRPSTSRHRGRS